MSYHIPINFNCWKKYIKQWRNPIIYTCQRFPVRMSGEGPDWSVGPKYPCWIYGPHASSFPQANSSNLEIIQLNSSIYKSAGKEFNPWYLTYFQLISPLHCKPVLLCIYTLCMTYMIIQIKNVVDIRLLVK
jgi:hypothetical protein